MITPVTNVKLHQFYVVEISGSNPARTFTVTCIQDLLSKHANTMLYLLITDAYNNNKVYNTHTLCSRH